VTRSRAVLATTVALIALAGCTSHDDDGDHEGDLTQARSELLEVGDVPGATSASDDEEYGRAKHCRALQRSEGDMQTFAQGHRAHRVLKVKDGTVESAVFGIAAPGTRAEVFDRGVVEEIESCVGTHTGAFGRAGKPLVKTTLVTEALSGLARGAVGYRQTLRGDDGSVTMHQRAFAEVGTRIVVVGCWYTEGGDAVSVADLLDKAVAKVQAAPAVTSPAP
jgi:hypothetical protein